jgi:hypothetical protein
MVNWFLTRVPRQFPEVESSINDAGKTRQPHAKE